ncbi:MAG: ribonuclease, partial [Frankiales bacterium]|nr:ribonuclease [Frankiales bacterium]
MLDTEPTGGGSDTAASALADTTPTNDTATANGTGAAPRRRRRATPAAEAAPAAEALTQPAVEAPVEASAEAPAPRRRRAATRPASAPGATPGATAEALATEVAPVPETPEAPAAAPAARRTRAARRPAGQPATVEAAPEVAQAPEAAEAELPTKAARPTRSRRRPQADQPAESAEPAELVIEAAAEPTDVPAVETSEPPASRSRRRRTTAVQFAPPVDGAGDPVVDVVVPAKAVLPPIGALFQAPDPSNATPARRRRVATRPEAPAATLLDADGQPLEAELAEELLADATDAVVLDAESSLESEEIDEEDGTEDDGSSASAAGRRRRRGRRGRGRGRPEDTDGTDASADPGEAAAEAQAPRDETAETAESAEDDEMEDDGRGGTRRRRRRRRRGGSGEAGEPTPDDPPNTVVRVRSPRREPQSSGGTGDDEVRGLTGSTRLEAKRQRRREGREQGKRRPPILTEAEFLARREAVDRVMVVRQSGDRTQIAVLEDTVLVEHYVTKASATSYAGNVYLGKVQNVLPSMEAAFVDIGKGRNGVLYAGEVNYDASGLEGKPRKIEQALKSGQSVVVQVTKDPIGHKGARLTSQISLPGRYMVYVPEGGSAGISRKLPDTERARLRSILKKVTPEDAGVIVRTAAEGASEEELTRDISRLATQWEQIQKKAAKASPPSLLYGEPDLVIRVIRDVFNEDFNELVSRAAPSGS